MEDSFPFAVWVGVVSTAVWAGAASVLRWRRNRRDFGQLAGRFRERGKYSAQASEDARELEITVRGNLLAVRYTVLPPRQALAGGISMSEAFRRSGNGHYHHQKPTDAMLWGFWVVQVKDENTILVHTEYADQNKHLVAQGYVWERLENRPALPARLTARFAWGWHRGLGLPFR